MYYEQYRTKVLNQFEKSHRKSVREHCIVKNQLKNYFKHISDYLSENEINKDFALFHNKKFVCEFNRSELRLIYSKYINLKQVEIIYKDGTIFKSSGV